MHTNPTGTGLRDLGVVVLESRPVVITYLDLGLLIERGEQAGVPPEAITAARARLEAARDGGNENAADVLRQLAGAGAA